GGRQGRQGPRIVRFMCGAVHPCCRSPDSKEREECPSGASLSFGAPCTTVRTGVNGHSFVSRPSPSGGPALAGQRGRADPGGAQSVLRSPGHKPALPARRHVGVRAAGLFWSRPSALASGPWLARLVGVEVWMGRLRPRGPTPRWGG